MNVSPNSTQGAANKIRSCRGHTGLGHRTERLDVKRFGSSKKATKFPRGVPCFLVGDETRQFEKNISQIGSFPQVGMKINRVWNHHLVVRMAKMQKFLSIIPKWVSKCCTFYQSLQSLQPFWANLIRSPKAGAINYGEIIDLKSCHVGSSFHGFGDLKCGCFIEW